MKTKEARRLLLLSEEGLLCPSCHRELHGKTETDTGQCQRCIRRVYWLTHWFVRRGGA